MIPNVVQVSVIDFDMNKYFQAMWIAVAIARGLAHPSLAAARRSRVVLLLSVPSPLLVAAWTATSNLQVISTADLAAVALGGGEHAGRCGVRHRWLGQLADRCRRAASG